MQNFQNFLKTELNPQQKKAVIKKNGAMIVVAGAGSGKTRVITARITNLILKHNVNPLSILALTFTNKAAGEMKERIISFLGTSSHFPFVGTFHSYCLLLLKTNRSLLPFPDFSIMDDDDQKALLKKILKKNHLEKQFSPNQLSYQISKAKNEVTKENELFKNPLLKEIFLAYETEKAAAHCLDFDDLLITTLKIFKNNKEFKKKFQLKVKHILVDEYQDTNGVQHELLKEMALTPRKKFNIDSICAVGDEDQSIYSWRGAVVTNMLSFKQDFKPVITIKIEQNYRSVQPILTAANNVIQNNSERYPKELWSNKKATNRILLLECQSGYQEANTISAYLKSRPQKTNLKDVAILYRTHFQSRKIEEALIQSSLPYIIVGGIRFYERKEIKDLLAYLRLLINPFDRTSLFRIINTPTRGLGAKFEELLYTEWNNNPLLNFEQILKFLLNKKPGHVIKGEKALSIKNFLKIFKNIKKKSSPSKIFTQLLEDTAYLGFLRRKYDPNEADTKIENLNEFANSIETFEKKLLRKKTKSTTNLLEEFLHEIALLQEKIEAGKTEKDHVQMMTLHAAKGLEFNTIIITGLEEGLLPSSRSLQSEKDIEEERRLFYVGITRAKERLIITNTKYRSTYGQITDQIPSRFISEVPQKLINCIDLTQIHPAQIKALIAQWLGSKVSSSVTTYGNFSYKEKKKISTKQVSTKQASSKIFKYKASKSTKNSAPQRTKAPWKKNQPVIHKKFGIGIIKKVDKESAKQYYLTIFFKSGEKKILSKFVKAINS